MGICIPIRPQASQRDYSSVLETPPPATICDRIIDVVANIALLAFNAFACWNMGWLWTVSFLLIGPVFRYEIESRITKLFNRILLSDLLWKLVIPTAVLLYVFELPGIATAQAVLAGADLGSRLAIKAEEYLNSGQKRFFWFMKC